MALEGKVAVITGGSRGIGKAIALRFASEGASVAVHYNSSEKAAENVVSEIERNGGKAICCQANVSDSKSISAVFDRVEEHFGKIDIVVASAGVLLRKPLLETSDEEFDHIFKTNVYGAFYTAREAGKRIASNSDGRIILISSTATKLMSSLESVYGASKGAVTQLAKHLAMELGSRNITVNAISPGPIDTDMLADRMASEEHRKMFQQSIALGRVGLPEEIADVALFFAKRESKLITGQELYVNGGM
ncbi:hypothetical protein ABG067_007405 [Albugo candida]